jgi:hypothetical protein
MENIQLRILFSKIYGYERDKLLPLDGMLKKYNYIMQRESIMQDELDNIVKTKIFDKERLNSKGINIYSIEEYQKYFLI